jgi:hypothetical protein
MSDSFREKLEALLVGGLHPEGMHPDDVEEILRLVESEVARLTERVAELTKELGEMHRGYKTTYVLKETFQGENERLSSELRQVKASSAEYIRLTDPMLSCGPSDDPAGRKCGKCRSCALAELEQVKKEHHKNWPDCKACVRVVNEDFDCHRREHDLKEENSKLASQRDEFATWIHENAFNRRPDPEDPYERAKAWISELHASLKRAQEVRRSWEEEASRLSSQVSALQERIREAEATDVIAARGIELLRSERDLAESQVSQLREDLEKIKTFASLLNPDHPGFSDVASMAREALQLPTPEPPQGSPGAPFTLAPSGLWRCTSCGEGYPVEFLEQESAWRWTGTTYQHKCGGHPQAGHFDAEWFGTPEQETKG